ncbi:MAG: DUF3185 family protein [Gammaproteobacteria bacterium]|nr:DUF3185 family protein [Gammaproteobacteria bacterium]
MNQNKIIGVALLVAGAVLLYFGFNAANAPSAEIAEAITGQYSYRTMMFMGGGAVSAVVGLVMLIKK